MDFIAFSWNSVNVYWYGIVMAVAVILGLAISWINVWLHKENFDIIIKIMVWGIPCSIVGARIVYVMQNMDYFSKNLARFFVYGKVDYLYMVHYLYFLPFVLSV